FCPLFTISGSMVSRPVFWSGYLWVAWSSWSPAQVVAPTESPMDLRYNLEEARRATDATPVLSVVIVSWNTCDLLGACLSSIATAAGEALRGAMELFVVDNGSSDGSAQMLQERFPWVTLLRNDSNVGFARANNQAIRLSK